jgi:hypothetical protein
MSNPRLGFLDNLNGATPANDCLEQLVKLNATGKFRSQTPGNGLKKGETRAVHHSQLMRRKQSYLCKMNRH